MRKTTNAKTNRIMKTIIRTTPHMKSIEYEEQ